MTGLPEGFEPLDSCTCEWCEAWRKKEKAKARRKEKIDPTKAYTFDSVDGSIQLYVERTINNDGVYIQFGNWTLGRSFLYEDARKLARVLKAMSK